MSITNMIPATLLTMYIITIMSIYIKTTKLIRGVIMGGPFPNKYEYKIIRKLKKMGVYISDDLYRSKLHDLMKHYKIKMKVDNHI